MTFSKFASEKFLNIGAKLRSYIEIASGCSHLCFSYVYIFLQTTS